MVKKSKGDIPAKRTASKPRVRKLTRRHKKKVVRTYKKLPNSINILKQALTHMWQSKKLYAGILLIFGLLYIVLVKGFATEFQLAETSDAIADATDEGINGPTKAFALLGALFGTTGTTSGEAAGVYQVLLFLIISLVLIWTLRQTFDGRTKLTVREAYYKSMYPFVPYVIVWLVIVLQLLPAIIATSIYSFVGAEGIIVGAAEHILWLLFLLAGILLSLYFVSSSAFASYIVTLPNMTPMRALRSARKLVRYRRWSIIRKVVFLPIFVFVCMVLIFLPLVFFAPVLAEMLFVVAGVVLLLLAHSYMYVLYRELL